MPASNRKWGHTDHVAARIEGFGTDLHGDPTISGWLKRAHEELLRRDPLDALADCELLLARANPRNTESKRHSKSRSSEARGREFEFIQTWTCLITQARWDQLLKQAVLKQAVLKQARAEA